MGIMTVQTTLLDRVVFELRFRNRAPNRLMTIDTELIAGFQKNGLMIGCVRIVTFYAVPFGDHFVDTVGFIWDDAFMALGTDLIGIVKK